MSNDKDESAKCNQCEEKPKPIKLNRKQRRALMARARAAKAKVHG